MSLHQEQIIDNVIVAKIGTSTLVRPHPSGLEQLDTTSFQYLGQQLTQLQEAGNNIVIVSSAAISAGIWEAGVTERPNRKTRMHELQRLASIGWRHVLNEWAEAMPSRTIGQLLLTRQELDIHAAEREEAIRTAHTLLRHGNIPIINENDAITHEEIEFGDNDTLAATFAAQLGRSALFGNRIQLILLTDVDGVYSEAHDPTSIIRVIGDIDQFEHLGQDTPNKNAAGGMKTKFDAARIATAAGIEMWVANGRTEKAIERTLAGEIGTRFTV